MIQSSDVEDPRAPALRVGIVGLGRSGWNIHAKTLASLPGLYQIAAVADPEQERCEEARQAYGCKIFRTFDGLVQDPGLDLIVVASPNHLHTEHTISALQSGKHVVCEKPFALNCEDADRAIAESQRSGKVLSPFQHRRYEAHFEKVRDLINSGTLGEVVNVRMVWHQFTRRWDWQTLSRYGGGLLNNNGSHLLDHALQLLPDDIEPDIFVDLRRVLTLGDTEDHVKIVLKADGYPTLDVELTNACAYEQDRWLVMGSQGGLRGTAQHLEWRTVDWDRLPPRELQTEPVTERVYSRDDVTWQTHHWAPDPEQPHEYTRYYHDLYRTICHGEPLVIAPQSVRRLIKTLERCYKQCQRLSLANATITGHNQGKAPCTQASWPISSGSM